MFPLGFSCDKIRWEQTAAVLSLTRVLLRTRTATARPRRGGGGAGALVGGIGFFWILDLSYFYLYKYFYIEQGWAVTLARLDEVR